MQELADGGEQDGCQHVKEENNGYGLGNLIVIRIDYRRRGCNGGTAADGGAHTHQSGNVGWDMHELMEHKGNHQGGGDGAHNDGKGLPSRLQHHM